MKAISPEQAKSEKLNTIPDFVFTAVNELIVERYTDSSFLITQHEIIDRILEITSGFLVEVTHNSIFENKWLDFEEVYRKAGWEVQFDKPGWDETYKPFFRFSKKKSASHPIGLVLGGAV